MSEGLASITATDFANRRTVLKVRSDHRSAFARRVEEWKALLDAPNFRQRSAEGQDTLRLQYEFGRRLVMGEKLLVLPFLIEIRSQFSLDDTGFDRAVSPVWKEMDEYCEFGVEGAEQRRREAAQKRWFGQ